MVIRPAFRQLLSMWAAQSCSIFYKGKSDSMKIKTNVKVGGRDCPDDVCMGNHNEKIMKSLTVKSGFKAGLISTSKNHNEKLADDATEQKKSFGKKLRLSKETIRDLRAGRILKIFELKQAAGGAAISGQTN